MKHTVERARAHVGLLAMLVILMTGVGLTYAEDAVLTDVKTKESLMYLHRTSAHQFETSFTCNTENPAVGWDYFWPSELGYPSEEWWRRVAIQWEWDSSILHPNAVITNVQLDVGIGAYAAQWGLNQFQIRERPTRIPHPNCFPAPGEPGYPPCESVFQVMSGTIYASPGGWNVPNSRKVINLGPQAIADIQARVSNEDPNDNFFAIAIRSTQEENYAEGGNNSYCIFVDPPGILDCTDAVHLAGSHILTVRYYLPSNPLEVSLRDIVPDLSPAEFALLGNEPNPFSHETTIRYSVPASGGSMKLSVYDVRGTLVRILANGIQIPGVQAVVWDGRSRNGQRVPSGIYFYRLESEGAVQTRKMILTK